MQKKRKQELILKKLGCLFEAFLGALFLDFNKITILTTKNIGSKMYLLQDQDFK